MANTPTSPVTGKPKRKYQRKAHRSAQSAIRGNIKRSNVGRGRTAGNTDRNLILQCMANLSSLL